MICARLFLVLPREKLLANSKDFKDFQTPDIKNELAVYNCRLLTNFHDGLGFIRLHA